MTIGIYGLFDFETGECLYVGQSINIESRWNTHIKSLKSEKHRRNDFIEWFKAHKSNRSAIDFRILEICENNDLTKNQLEIKWFKELNPLFFGKQPSENETWKQSEGTKKKISDLSNERNFGKRMVDTERICVICTNAYFHGKRSIRTCSIKCGRTLNAGAFIETNKPNKNELSKLYIQEKLNLYEISKIFKTSSATISKLLKEFNIPTRNRNAATEFFERKKKSKF